MRVSQRISLIFSLCPSMNMTIIVTCSYLLLLLFCWQRSKSLLVGASFEPLTENVALKAIYRVQTFVDQEVDSVSELHEYYQANLASSSVSLHRRFHGHRTEGETQTKRYLYNGDQRVDVELTGSESLDWNLTFGEGANQARRQWAEWARNSQARTLDGSPSSGLDSHIFAFQHGSVSNISLDLSHFLTNACKLKAEQELHYVRGLTRLLHLIECRRSELLLQENPNPGSDDPSNSSSRGAQSSLYSALNLQANGFTNEGQSDHVRSMNISVSLHRACWSCKNDHNGGENRASVEPGEVDAMGRERAKEGSLENERKVLASRAVPVSIGLEMLEAKITIIINLFQVEVISPDEHLSMMAESGGDQQWSIFLLPPARGLDLKLKWPLNSASQPRLSSDEPTSFSFRAFMSGGLRASNSRTNNKLNNGQPAAAGQTRMAGGVGSSSRPGRFEADTGFGQLRDPVELVVAFDRKAGLLARQLSLVDRDRLLGHSYGRHTSRLVYDARARYKFHLMRSNSGYQHSLDHLHQGECTESGSHWRTCVTDITSASEESKIVQGGGDLFELERALYLGQARVRGVVCNVYERRIYLLPLWMGFDDLESIHPAGQAGQYTYATIYQAAHYVGAPDSHQASEKRRRLMEMRKGPIIRLEVNLVSSREPLDGSLLASYQFDLYQFAWSLEASFGSSLFQVAQDCLLTEPGLRHLDMELELAGSPKPGGFQDLAETRTSLQRSHLRDQVLAHSLIKAWSLAGSQQVHLETSWRPEESTVGARLKVYELPKLALRLRHLGFVHDLSLGSAKWDSWSEGATSASLLECRWRAAHSLIEAGQSRLFMFCPASLHCLLMDPARHLDKRGHPVTDSHLFRYPVDGPETRSNRERCFLAELTLEHLDPNLMRQLEPLGSLDRLIWSQASKLGQLIELELAEHWKESFQVSSLHLSNPIRSGLPEGSLRHPLQGIGYQPDRNEQDELGWWASYEAQCDQVCLMDQRCLSYSMCRRAGGPKPWHCLMSRINWTEPDKVEELRRLALHHSDSGQRSVQMQLLVEGEHDPVHLQLRVSALCSIHQRRHLDLFQSNSSWNQPRLEAPASSGAHLLLARSSDQCARLCLERARALEPFWPEPVPACTSFRFGSRQRTCQLLPEPSPAASSYLLHKADELVQSGQASPDLERWLSAWQQYQQLPDKALVQSVETFQLMAEQLFLAQSGLRLVASGAQSQLHDRQQLEQLDSPGDQFQLSLAGLNGRECAELCLQWHQCRSFDLLLQSNEPLGVCQLNEMSLADLANINRSSLIALPLKPERLIGQSKALRRAWHYEPSQLALYASAKLASRSLEPEGAGQVSLFIMPARVARGFAWNDNRKLGHRDQNQPDGGLDWLRWLLLAATLACALALLAYLSRDRLHQFVC